MKLINLFENTAITNHKQLVKLIQTDCAEYLDIIKDPTQYKLLRGFYPSDRMEKIFNDQIFKADVRKDRQPQDTDKQVSEFVDEWFYKKFGSKFRSEALFCVGNRLVTRKYGTAFVIFPIGKMSYCWSPVYHDFYQSNSTLIGKFKNRGDDDLYWGEINKILKEGKYTDTDLIEALSFHPRHEIMINCDSYYAIQYDYFNNNFIPAWETFK